MIKKNTLCVVIYIYWPYPTLVSALGSIIWWRIQPQDPHPDLIPALESEQHTFYPINALQSCTCPGFHFIKLKTPSLQYSRLEPRSPLNVGMKKWKLWRSNIDYKQLGFHLFFSVRSGSKGEGRKKWRDMQLPKSVCQALLTLDINSISSHPSKTAGNYKCFIKWDHVLPLNHTDLIKVIGG